MNADQILSLFRSLSSQGFYGRLLAHIKENPDYLQFLVDMNFQTELDLILYLES